MTVDTPDNVIHLFFQFKRIYNFPSSPLNTTPDDVIAPASEPAPGSVRPKQGTSLPSANLGK